MKFKVHNRVFYIEDKYVAYSPYLSTLVNTQLEVDKDRGIPIVTQVDIPTFIAYIRFLEGKDFHFNRHIERFFDYMGHVNIMQYPLDYWKVKLQDNWIRDNFYRLELYKDPYYGLVDISHMSIFNLEDVAGLSIFKDLQNAYVAGGFALLLVDGVLRKRKIDIDIFTTDRKSVISYLKQQLQLFPNNTLLKSKNAVTNRNIWLKLKIFGESRDLYVDVTKQQFILREYRCPSEIVHGFDVDCCGVLFDIKNRKLYATKRALYAITNRVNWFDPERSSPSYAYRLAKYKLNGGYQIKLPRFNEVQIDEYYKKQFEESMYDIIRKDSELKGIVLDVVADDIGRDNTAVSDEMVDLARQFITDGTITNRVYQLYLAEGFQIYKGNIIAAVYGINKYYGGEYDKNIRDITPKDPVTVMLLAILYNYVPGFFKKRDYDVDGYRHEEEELSSEKYKEYNMSYENIRDEKEIDNLEWTTINPMQQLSNTFYPQPVHEELITWYKQSPFVKK